MLKNIEEDKQRNMREKAERREKLNKESNLGKNIVYTDNNNEDNNDNDDNMKSEIEPNMQQWYKKEMYQVIEQSDIILFVLDARDPMGCRCKEIEKKIIQEITSNGENKRIILIQNKIDLVPKDITERWITYLRREYPTIGLKSSTQKKNEYLGSINGDINILKEKAITSKLSIGINKLVELLKNYSRDGNSNKKSITVGVLGYPNVGKSSIINSLKSCYKVQVSSTPGCTKTIQTIRLDKSITLLDSPGVLFVSKDKPSSQLLLQNAIRIEQISDPVNVVENLLQRCPLKVLLNVYNIDENNCNTIQNLLYTIAMQRGKLSKGGIPNIVDSARIVLNDWYSGHIPFYVEPPVVDDILESKVFGVNDNSMEVDMPLHVETSSDDGEDSSEDEVHTKIPNDSINNTQDKTKNRKKNIFIKRRMGRAKAQSVMDDPSYDIPSTSSRYC